MTAAKKIWTQPQLVILGRGTPEESVLAWCKDGAAKIPGAIAKANKNCIQKPGAKCANCNVTNKT